MSLIASPAHLSIRGSGARVVGVDELGEPACRRRRRPGRLCARPSRPAAGAGPAGSWLSVRRRVDRRRSGGDRSAGSARVPAAPSPATTPSSVATRPPVRARRADAARRRGRRPRARKGRAPVGRSPGARAPSRLELLVANRGNVTERVSRPCVASDDPARRARPRSTASAGTRPASAHGRDRRGSVPAARAGPGLGSHRRRRARRASDAALAAPSCLAKLCHLLWMRARHDRVHPGLERGGQPPGRARRACRRPARRRRARRRRRLDRPDRRDRRRAGRAGALVRREPRPPRRDRSRVRVRPRARLRLRGPRRRRRPASGRTSSRACSRSFARATPTSPSARGSSAARAIRSTATSRARRGASAPRCSGGG